MNLGQNPIQGMPTPPGQPAVSPGLTPEQKADLTEKVRQVQAQLDSVKADKFASDNKVDIYRKEMMGQVFEKFQSAGVNLSDRNSVAKFIMELQESEPELAKMFETSMGAIIGTPEAQPEQPAE